MPKFCTGCGSPMDPDWTFCGECGTPVPAAPAPAPTPTPQQPPPQQQQPQAPPRPQPYTASPSWGSGNTLQSFRPPPEVSAPTNVTKNNNDTPQIKTIPLSQAQAKFGGHGGGGHRRSLSVGEGAEPSMTYSNVGTRNDFNQTSPTPSAWGNPTPHDDTKASRWGGNNSNNANTSTLVSSRGNNTIATFNPEMPTIKKGTGGTLFTFGSKKAASNNAPPKPKPQPRPNTGPKGEPPAAKIFNFVSKKVGEAKEATKNLEHKHMERQQAPQQSWGGNNSANNTTPSGNWGHNNPNNTTGSWGGNNSANNTTSSGNWSHNNPNNTTGSWGGNNSASNNTTSSWGGNNTTASSFQSFSQPNSSGNWNQNHSANNNPASSWGGTNSANDTTASSYQSFSQPSSGPSSTTSTWGNNQNSGANTTTTTSTWGNNQNSTTNTTTSTWGNNQSNTTHSTAPQKPAPAAQAQSGPPKISAKQEEEYIKNHEGKKQIDDYYERKRRQSMLAKTVDPTQCFCNLQMGQAEIRMKGNKQDFVAFRIDITFDQSSWSIYRRWKQFVSMDHVFSKEVYGYQKSLPNIDKQQHGGKHAKFNPNFIELRRSGLQNYLNIIISARGSIFASRNGGNAFFKFIAPTQLGDIKPKGFIMPFKLTL